MVMTQIVGDIDIFAIEFDVQSRSTKLMGMVRIWLSGKYLGAIEDINILTVTLHQLERVFYSKLYDKHLGELNPKDAYCLIKEDRVEGAGKHFLSLGESFDDFSVVLYGCDENLIFVWKLNEDHFFDYPGYPAGIQYALVPIDCFAKTVEKFKKRLPL